MARPVVTRTQLAYAAAGVAIALGVLGLVNPTTMARLVGLEIAEPRGSSEIRATYGGLFLTLGGVMLWAVSNRPKSLPWLRFVGMLWLAMALGRFSSIILDGPLSPMNLAALALELLVGGMALLAASQPRSSRSPAPPPRKPLEERQG